MVGSASALNDFTVADANNDNLTLTLTASNGALVGLADADSSLAGIQLTGSASQINAAIADATFNATAAGPASIGLSLSDGKASAVIGTYSLTASIKSPSEGTSGNDIFIGTIASDSFSGGLGNDMASNLLGGDYFNGGDGTDTAVLSLNSKLLNETLPYNFSWDVSGDLKVTGYSGWSSAVVTLAGVERVHFADGIKFALDVLEGNAGKALEFIGIMAPNLVNDPAIVGAILSIFDQDKSMKEVCQLAIDIGLTSQLAGSKSNLDLAKLVFRNVAGSEASAETANDLAGYIQGNGGSMTQADFLATIAQLDLNDQHIGLIGFQSTGVQYIV